MTPKGSHSAGAGEAPRQNGAAKPNGSQVGSQRPVARTRAVSPSRPPKKKSSNKPLVIIAVVLALAVVGVAGYAFYLLSTPAASKVVELPVTIEVPSGASTKDIGEILVDEGLIGNTNSFVEEVKSAGMDGKLQAGTYSIPTTDLKTIVEILTSGADTSMVKLAIPEGLTNKQVAARVEKALGIPASEFLAIADSKAADYADRYPFLEGAYNGSMEGYLFPKTYSFPKDATADYVISKMLAQFNKEFNYVDMTWAKSKGYSESDVVIVASLIEKEARIADERGKVASVIYNRLDKDMKLQLCSSVQYLLGENKTRLTVADTKIDSPYNTYQNKGLPPGPVSNPGLDSLVAAANPDDTEYLYFVLTGKDGSQTFSKTWAEHEKASAKSKQVLGE